MDKILDIFYNQIVNEAANGEIDAYLIYNICFSTNIFEKGIRIDAENKYDEVIVPTLNIDKKEEFDKLLCEYILLAMPFYDEFEKLYQRFDCEKSDENKLRLNIKTLFVNLFSNATLEDFNNPCEFLRKRIDFINNNCEEKFSTIFSEELNASFDISIEKDKISNETPYQFIISITDDENKRFDLPSIKFGIYDGKAYIYAMQNRKDVITDSKKINRLLYKIGEGFDQNIDNKDLYEEGNLKDVTSSFLVALNMFISYLNTIGIKEIVVPSILIERWNAKEVSSRKRLYFNRINEEEYEKLKEFHNDLQSNLTEKLVRTCMRLGSHYEDFKILSLPMEIDDSLHIDISNNKTCNNHLLRVTRDVVSTSLENKKYLV